MTELDKRVKLLTGKDQWSLEQCLSLLTMLYSYQQAMHCVPRAPSPSVSGSHQQALRTATIMSKQALGPSKGILLTAAKQPCPLPCPVCQLHQAFRRLVKIMAQIFWAAYRRLTSEQLAFAGKLADSPYVRSLPMCHQWCAASFAAWFLAAVLCIIKRISNVNIMCSCTSSWSMSGQHETRGSQT